MKKWLAVIVTSCMLLTGCTVNHVETTANKNEMSMFTVVEQGPYWWVLYHKDTKVMYTMSNGIKNYGNFTRLDKPDGSPLLWEGEY